MSGYGFQLNQARSIRLTSSLRQAIGFLSMSNHQITEFLQFRAVTNPFLELRASQDDPGKGTGGTGPTLPAERSATGGSGLDVGRIADAPQGLLSHVREQVALSFRQADEMRIAEHFIEALEPTGWLGQPVADIAEAARCPPEKANIVLSRLQQLDPPGIFARSLSECLKLQAIDAGRLDPVMECVLQNLELIAKARLSEVADLCGSTPEDVAERLAVIRGFDPKPGAGFGDQPQVSVVPDLVVTRKGAGWKVDVRNPMLGAVFVRAPEEVSQDGARLSVPERALLDEARWIKRAAERRDTTLLTVGAEIVRRQEEFLKRGPTALLPMRLADVADALGLHESTVSRITSGRHVATPRGTVRLKDFFSVAVGDPDGAALTSAACVRERIRLMLAEEDKTAPLSDQQIAEGLRSHGLTVARRTISKYRDQLGLPGSTERKRNRIIAEAAKRR